MIDFFIEGSFKFIYAANLEYDINNLFASNMTLVTRYYVAGRLLYATAFNIEFRDASWLENPVASVRHMGEQLGLPKLDMPKTRTATSEMVVYCARDAEIVLRWIRLVTEDFERIGVKLHRTLPSTSLRYFRNVHGQVPPDPPMMIGNMPLRQFIRRGYFGGRTEIFRLGPIRTQVHCADVSSMYPSVMKDFDYPDPSSAYIPNNLDINRPGAYYCDIHAPPSLDIPALPIRLDGWTVFPTGTFSGVWMAPELQFAKSLGYRIRIKSGVSYRNTYKPFEEVITTLYEWKAKGHSRAKFIMNSLYGKFGEQGQLVEMVGNKSTILQNDPAHANVIWAAYVTCYARLRLYHGFQRLSKKGCELLYCDTDSCFYTGDKVLDDGKQLGAWEHKDTKNCFEAKSPKIYRFGDIYHTKGVPRSEAKKYFLLGEATFNKPNRYRESLRRGLVINRWESVMKQTSFLYVKRKRLRNGRTIPLQLLNGESRHGN